MPSYDFLCKRCGHAVTLRFKSVRAYDAAAAAAPLRCPHCGGQLERAIRRVTVARGDAARLAAVTDESALAALDHADPAALGEAMRSAGAALGHEMGEEFDEVAGRLAHGEAPEEIAARLAGGKSGDAGDDPEDAGA